MKYAILDGITVVKTGKLETLFPNTSFPASGVPADFLTENNMVEFLSTLPFTEPAQKLVAADPYVKEGKVYNVLVTDTDDADKSRLTKNKWREVRSERDRLLAECDWRTASDRTLEDDWKTYRQQLRDLPASTTDPYAVVFPNKPMT